MPPSFQPPGTEPPAPPAGQPQPPVQVPAPAPASPPTGAPGQVIPQRSPNAYDFITSPEKPPVRPSFSLPGSSTTMRAVYIAGGLLVLLVIFIIIKGLFGGGSNLTPYDTVAEDQQELIHLVVNASQQTNTTVADQNFAATAQLSLTSSLADTVKYLANNGQKISTKILDSKVSTATDTQLVNAASAGTYDQTFQQVMQGKLTAYISDLQQAYRQTSGKNGHALLSDEYKQAQLLLTQLNAASPQSQ